MKTSTPSRQTPITESVENKTVQHRGQRRQARQAMALVGTMLVLMLILAATLIGFAKMNGKTSGDLGSTSSNMLLSARTRVNIISADNLADAGLRAGVQWISELSGPPLNSSAFTPIEVTPNDFFYNSGRWDSGKWTYVNFPDSTDPSKGQFRVRFYPHSDNATAAQRAFLVESVGVVNGVTRVVRADIQQQNFAQFAYFTDQVGSGSWIAGRTTFNGPVHINNSNGADINIIWDGSSTPDISRIFQWDGDNAFSMWSNKGVNNSKIKWQKNTSGNYQAPMSDPDWSQILVPKTTKDVNGNVTSTTARKGPVLVDAQVNMPVNSSQQLDAALGGITEASYTASGVYVPSTGGANAAAGTPTGGVYIRGQVDDMVFEATGVGNKDQNVYIYQGGNATTPSNVKYVLRMNANGTTVLNRFSRSNTALPFNVTSDTGYPKTYSGGATNGVIYSYDDIGDWGAKTGGVSGTIANSVADAGGNVTQLNKINLCSRVDTNNKKTIMIDGNILYANTSKTAVAAPADAGVLGIVAGYIQVVPTARVMEPAVTGFVNRTPAEDGAYANGATLTDLSVHSTLMAYKEIDVINYASRNPGQFRLLGGYIASIGTPFGQVIGGAGANAFNMLTGFQRILNYDKRVANQPPPFFPGTGQAYQIISYQRLLQPLQP